MDRGTTEGGTRSGGALGRWAAGVAEVWRERRSERRARAAARLGATPRLPRSTLAAVLDARLAVRAGVRLDDFLRHRLARYAGKLPVTLDALPATVDVEAGEVVVRARSRARAVHGPRPEQAGPAAAACAGGWAARELRDAETALDGLEARAAEARAAADVVEREIVAALASGAIVARPAVDATAEQLGRPPVPSPLPIHGLRAFVGLLLAAEAWRVSGPILGGAGVAPEGLEAALRVAPLATFLALLFAVGAAAAAFTFAWLALARGADAVDAGVAAGRRPLLVAASATAAALVPAVAAAASAPDHWAQLALLAALPFGAAALIRAAAALALRRDAAAVLALAWDRERTREATERGRREEVWLRAAEALRAAEDERAEARRRLARLHRDAAAAERTAELSARAEADRLERLCEALACALELDRYLYVRFAAERAGAGLQRPRARVVEGGVPTERLGVAS